MARPRKYFSEDERRKVRKERAWEERQRVRAGSRDDGITAAVHQYLAQKGRRNRHPTALTSNEKRELAAKLLEAAGEIMDTIRRENPPSWYPPEAARQLALWLKDLPGEGWDSRLGLRHWQEQKIESFLDHAEAESEPGVKIELKFP